MMLVTSTAVIVMNCPVEFINILPAHYISWGVGRLIYGIGIEKNVTFIQKVTFISVDMVEC
jgi:hypothetical protein